ncbi:Diacylglycerol o-acyltransferase 2, partial [Globisporangium splendens]
MTTHLLKQRRPPGAGDLQIGMRSAVLKERRPSDRDSANDAAMAGETPAPLEHMSPRGIFLLVMAFLVFAAFVLFVLSEMTHHHKLQLLHTVLITPEMQDDVHTACLWVLMLAIPITSVAAWFPVSITQVPGTHGFRIKSPLTPSSPSRTGVGLPFMQQLAHRFQTNHYFRAYQTLAWVLYGVFLTMVLTCSPLLQTLLPSVVAAIPYCAFGYRSNAAVVAFISQVLLISSILALERRRDRNRQGRKDRFVLILNNFNNMLLLVGAVLLAIGSEYTRHHTKHYEPAADENDAGHKQRLGYLYSFSSGLGSLALFVTALFNTYGLGGFLSTKRGWRFYQPFMGGAKFVLFQIISWTCFGAGVLVQGLYLLSIVLVEMELFVGVMAVAGALFGISQVVMMMSLFVFRRASSPKSSASTTTSPTAPQTFIDRLQAFADECLGAVVIGMLANLQWIPSASFFVIYAATTNLDAYGVTWYGFATVLAEIFFVLTRSVSIHLYSKDSNYGAKKDVSPYRFKYLFPPMLSLLLPGIATYYHYVHDLDAFLPVACLSAFLYVYAFTYRGDPQHTGIRMKENWVTTRSRLIECVKTYFQGKIIREAPLNPSEHYVMAFHPHGIMPTTAMWLLFTERWRELFPGVHPHLLTASVLHQIPLSRDIMQILGSLEVTRQAFTNALREKRSVMLVPGGQAEMLEQRSQQKQVRVYTKHKGFIRVAIEHGTPLVPVLSFKEGELMDNVNAPLIQKWFVKNLAFPFPYFPYGRWLLPIPRKVETTVVVGAPIRVPRIENPDAEDVDAVHATYFAALQDMFDRHKDEAGCADYKLVLI